jgi:hypothetical protein
MKWFCGHCEEKVGVLSCKFFYGNANTLCLNKIKVGKNGTVLGLLRFQDVMSFAGILDYLARMIVKCMHLHAVLISCCE